MVTVNDVKVSRDLGYADIYISLLSTEELTITRSAGLPDGVEQGLRVSARAVGRAMKLRVVPHLRFHFDKLLGQSRKMDRLIREAVGDKPAVPRDDNDDPVSDNPERDA